VNFSNKPDFPYEVARADIRKRVKLQKKLTVYRFRDFMTNIRNEFCYPGQSISANSLAVTVVNNDNGP